MKITYPNGIDRNPHLVVPVLVGTEMLRVRKDEWHEIRGIGAGYANMTHPTWLEAWRCISEAGNTGRRTVSAIIVDEAGKTIAAGSLTLRDGGIVTLDA